MKNKLSKTDKVLKKMYINNERLKAYLFHKNLVNGRQVELISLLADDINSTLAILKKGEEK